MAKLTITICDLCKKCSYEELLQQISLINSDDTIEVGDICAKCFEALASRLKEEFDLASPRIPRAIPVEDTVIASVVPFGKAQIVGDVIESEDDGFNIVKSALTPRQINKLNAEVEGVCSHSDGVSIGDDGGFNCKKCGAAVT